MNNFNRFPKFIAEVSSNHNRSLKRCYEFIDKASLIGCYSVKFQLFKIDQLFSKDVLSRSYDHRKRKKWELPEEFIPKIYKRCKQKKIKFSCTPFYLEAVEKLKTYVDFFKISSYEILWNDLLIKCAQTKKPIIISSGMATLKEITSAVNILKKNGCKDITILHCVSQYPADIKNCNLKSISFLKQKTKCNVGWSDHTVNPLIINSAIEDFGASTIEFHLDIDKKGYEFEQGHCWTPSQILPIIDFYRLKKKIFGTNKKKYSKSEKEERLWRADSSDGLRPIKSIRQ